MSKSLSITNKRVKDLLIDKRTADECKREALPEVPKCLTTVNAQYDLLCALHYERQVSDELTTYLTFLSRELGKKVNGYKQQDIKKQLFDVESFIKVDEVRAKLIAELLTCTFCGNRVVLFYEKVRDECQWTLDRIDNDLGHSNDNTRIACLKCNLKRRRTDYDKFHWTKNLSISKIDE